jgi:lysophospholipase L1-like esterase
VIKKLALSLLSLLVALVGAELLIRAAGAAPEVSVIRKGRFQLSHNPKIGYEPVPGLHYEGQELSFYDYQGASNSLGYRDTEHAVAKPPGVYRVVVLGDSIAAGLKVLRYDRTFAPVLEKLLRQAGVPAEVINLSVSGYNTQQEVETLRDKGLRYRPDLVVVAYSLTDRERVDGDILKTLLEAERQKGGIAPVSAVADPLLLHSALYRFFRYRVLAPHPGTDDAELRRAVDLISGDTVAEYFGVLARLARESRFQVVIAVFPRLPHSFQGYPYGDQHRYVADLSARYGFHHLDLLEPFIRCRQAAPERRLGIDGYHPAPYGHHCAAAAMAELILEQARPPRR